MTQYRLLHTDRTGHHVWREIPTGRFVLSDHSADVRGDWRRPGDPRLTDDGVLYIDFTRPLRTRNASCLSVPLITDTGSQVTADVRFDIVRKIERLSARQFGTPDPAPPRGGRGPAPAPRPCPARTVAYERYDDGRVRVWLLQEYHNDHDIVWRPGGWLVPPLPYVPYWRAGR